MAWKIKRSPQLPTVPAFHHPGRCMNCGHLILPDTALNINESHDPDVGCLVEGGTKYIEDENGNGKHCCACTIIVPAPDDLLTFEAANNALIVEAQKFSDGAKSKNFQKELTHETNVFI